jgi:DNA-binding NarL/FixJ family response regulator
VTGLVLSDDLVFVSRIAATAQAAGLAVRQARSPAELLALAAKNPPPGVILDLQNPGLDLAALLTELRIVCPVMPRVTGYGSHVEAELLRSAREAGCDLVLPRSKFVKELDSQIATWLTGSGADPGSS